MSKSNNKVSTIKNIIINKINAESVKLGKDNVILIRYENGKLIIQTDPIKMLQYGFPAGEKLSNGVDNEYYQGEEGRNSFKFPLADECAVNKEDLTDIRDFLQNLDKHFKNDKRILEMLEIDEQQQLLYNPIYKKPKVNKKNGKNVDETKKKFDSFKCKLNIDYQTKKIITEFYLYDHDNKEYNKLDCKETETVLQLEKIIRYSSEVTPVFELVKFWTQSNGMWGVTLKLHKMRIKNPINTRKNENIDFVDNSDDETKEETKNTKSISKNNSKATSVVSSDDESDNDTINKNKKVATVISSDDESDNDTINNKNNSKKVAIVSSDDESDDDSDNKPVKSKIVQKKDVKSKNVSNKKK